MRLKIILGNLLIVVLVGVVSYGVVRSQLQTGLSQQIDERIDNDHELFDRSWRLSALEFVDQVSDRARTQDVTAIFTALDEQGRRQRAHRAANAISQWFLDPARGRQGGPDVVAITDETGTVIARDKDINRMHGQSLVRVLTTLPDVLKTGTPHHDVWWLRNENKLLQAAIAPIRNPSGAIVGALVVGYDLSNGLAKREADLLGRQVAFLYAGQVYSASIPSELVDPLEKQLFGRLGSGTKGALEGKSTAPWSIDLASGHSYVGVTAPLPVSPSAHVAYTVMADRSEHLGLVSTTNLILLLTALGALGVLIYGWLIASSLLNPLEQIEEDVLRVINGRTDVRIDVESAEFGGLAYRINQLINVFTGVAEEDEEGRVSQAPDEAGSGAWQGAAFAEAGGAGSPQPGAGGGGSAGGGAIDDPALAAQLEAEPAAQYYARIHREYVAAKQAAGEDVSSIPADRFTQRIQGNEKALAQKHGVRMVRFKVEANGVLRPVLIR